MSERKNQFVKVNGPELERLRKLAGLTIDELAEKAGVTSRTINDYTRGRSARIPALKYVAEALGVEFRDLLAEPLLKQLPALSAENRVRLDISVSIPYEEAEKSPILKAILDALKVIASLKGDIQVVGIREGSTIITVEMDLEDAVRLLECYFREARNYRVPELPKPDDFSIIEEISFPNSIDPDQAYSSIRADRIKQPMEWLYKFDRTPAKEMFNEAVLQFPKLIVATNVNNPAYFQKVWKSIKDRYPLLHPLRVFFKDNFPEFDEKILTHGFGSMILIFDPPPENSQSRQKQPEDDFDAYDEE